MPKYPNDAPPNVYYYEVACGFAYDCFRTTRACLYIMGGGLAVAGAVSIGYSVATTAERQPIAAADITRSAEAIVMGGIIVTGARQGYPLAMRGTERWMRNDFRVPDTYPAPEAFSPYADQYVVQLTPQNPEPLQPPQKRPPGV